MFQEQEIIGLMDFIIMEINMKNILKKDLEKLLNNAILYNVFLLHILLEEVQDLVLDQEL